LASKKNVVPFITKVVAPVKLKPETPAVFSMTHGLTLMSTSTLTGATESGAGCAELSPSTKSKINLDIAMASSQQRSLDASKQQLWSSCGWYRRHADI
jgi:hypothetical protein